MKTSRKVIKGDVDSPWARKIKVVGDFFMCFAADPITLEAVSCSIYDPYAWKDQETGPVETISTAEWYRRVDQRRLEGSKARATHRLFNVPPGTH